MTNTINCPKCGTRAASDIAHRKTCVNMNCEDNNKTYLHHEWIEKHNKLNKITVNSEVNKLMEAF